MGLYLGRCDACHRDGPARWFDRRLLCAKCADLALLKLIAETCVCGRVEKNGMAIDLELRLQGIGGSDVAAILGVDSDEREIWSVYNKKTGLLEPEPDEGTQMRRNIGKDLEQAIVRSYTRMTGHEAEWFDKTIQHPTRSWQVGSPDALSPSAKKPVVGIDAKNVAFDQRHLWGHPDDKNAIIPERYEWQTRWYMSLLDIDDWDIIALLGGSDLRIFRIERDLRLERQMLGEVENFWLNHVVPRVPPEFNYSRAAKDFVHSRYPQNRATVRIATEQEAALLERYGQVRAEAKLLDQDRKEMETKLKDAVGDDSGVRSDDHTFTWKKPNDSSVTDWASMARNLWDRFVPLNSDIAWEEQVEMFTRAKPLARRVWFSGE